MNRTVLAYLIGLISVLLVGVLLVGLIGGGLDRTLVAEATSEIGHIAATRTSLDTTRKQVEDWVQQEPDLFKPTELDVKYDNQLEAASQKLGKTLSVVEELERLLETNDKELAEQVRDATQSLRLARFQVAQEVGAVRDAGGTLIEFKKQVNERVPQMERDAADIRAFEFGALRSQVQQAVADWPEKQSDLEQRLQSLEELQKSSDEIWQSTAEARQNVANKKLDGSDLRLLIESATRIAEAKQALLHAPQNLGGLIDQLYWSWDKVLTDIEIVEGAQVTFRQTYQTIKTRALVSEDAEPQTEELPPETVPITKQTYEATKSNLGMTVEHKAAGKYDSESIKVVQPPGYAYIAPESQGRNHYGYWDRRPGGAVWIFFGGYSHFGRYMGYPTYGPVTTTMYDDYRQHRQTGTPYYGTTSQGSKLYGSGGSVTKTKYASSRYVSSGGFQSSQYVRSGGTYRGSAYQTRSSSSTSSSRSRSYSSRSSGFRGGGGGK